MLVPGVEQGRCHWGIAGSANGAGAAIACQAVRTAASATLASPVTGNRTVDTIVGDRIGLVRLADVHPPPSFART